MNSIQIIAFALLSLRLISITFMALVIYRQVRLFGTRINFNDFPHLTKRQRLNIYTMRRVLFVLAVVIMIGNIVPVAIDSVALLQDTLNSLALRTLGVFYAISNAVTSVISAFMIWFLYRLAGFGADET